MNALKRASTDAKLATLLQNNGDDEEAEEEFRRQEKLARQRLRRACLYGGGARTKVPRVKKVKKASKSPFALPDAHEETPPPQLIACSEPPGAHNDFYRIVQNPTMLSRNDADRVCINSKTMIEGVRSLPQPAWYVGYNNAPSATEGNHSILTASVRYGFRGSRDMLRYHTAPYELPSKTRTEHTPAFLRADDDFVDEYVPPVLMTTAQTINGMEAPRLWPENAEYVTGYPRKKLPTIWKYKRETTVDLPERPRSPDTLQNVFAQMTLERTTLQERAVSESRRTLTTPSGTARSVAKFQETWRNEIAQFGSSSLKRTLQEHNDHLHYLPQTLLDPTDTMRYSGSTAFIVHSQSNDEVKFRYRMARQQDKALSPYYLKWKQCILHFDMLARKLNRGQSIVQALDQVTSFLQQIALRGGSETSLRRADFVTATAKHTLFEDVSSRQMSQLYSTFDPNKKNLVRYVELLLRWRVLAVPEMHLLEKLQLLWDVSSRYGSDRAVLDRVLDVLCVCCGSAEDVREVESWVDAEFKSHCYELAVLGRTSRPSTTATTTLTNTTQLTSTGGNSRVPSAAPERKQSLGHTVSFADPPTSSNDKDKTAVSDGDNNKSGTRSSSSPLRTTGRGTLLLAPLHNPASTALNSTSQVERPDSAAKQQETISEERNKTLASEQQQAPATGSLNAPFNISEHFLLHGTSSNTNNNNGSTTAINNQRQDSGFIATLRLCPNLLSVLDEQLSARLVQCYGYDERRRREEAERERELRGPAEKRDFTWIMKQSERDRPARAVFSLFEK